jgi:PncC family amidohydrolase
LYPVHERMINESIRERTRNLARDLAARLREQGLNLVLAESCTAGLVSAVLAENPGVSDNLCGSAVTYQSRTKESWLQIDPGEIRQYTAVSPQVTVAMARAVLDRTPQADVAVAITGHLEPQAAGSEPCAWVASASRHGGTTLSGEAGKYQLDGATRGERQWQATGYALQAALQQLPRRKPAAG